MSALRRMTPAELRAERLVAVRRVRKLQTDLVRATERLRLIDTYLREAKTQ